MPASRRLRSWPETTWVRLSWRRQRVQVAASSAIRSSSVGIVTSPSSRTDADHPVVQGGGQVRPPEAWRARRNHTVRSVDGYRGDAYAPRRQVVGCDEDGGTLLKRVRRVSLLLAGLVLSAAPMAPGAGAAGPRGDGTGKQAPSVWSKDPRSGAALNRLAARSLQPGLPAAHPEDPRMRILPSTVNGPSADATAQDTQSETTIGVLGSNVIIGWNDSG